MNNFRSPANEPYLGSMNSTERRAAVQLEERARAAEREEQLAQQSSPARPPEDRIRTWERLHALKLPSSATHTLIRIIAVQTGLSVTQVHEEQRRRALGLPSTISSSPEPEVLVSP